MVQKLLKYNYWKPFLHFFFVHPQINTKFSFPFLPLIGDMISSTYLLLFVGKKSSEVRKFFRRLTWVQELQRSVTQLGPGYYKAAVDIGELWSSFIAQHSRLSSLSLSLITSISNRRLTVNIFQKLKLGESSIKLILWGQINSLLEGKFDKLMWILEYWQWKGLGCMSVWRCTVWPFTWNPRQVHCQPWRLTQKIRSFPGGVAKLNILLTFTALKLYRRMECIYLACTQLWIF